MAKNVKNQKKFKNPKKTSVKNILRKIEEYSSGTIQDSHNFKDAGKNLLNWLREDTLLRAALEIKFSTIQNTGYYWVGNVTAQKINRLKKLRFNKWMKDHWWQVLLYKNCFTELGKDSTGSVNMLAVVKTDQMEIVNTDTGTVLEYLQVVSNPDSTTQFVKFKPERMVHFSYNNIGNSLWGESEIPVVLKKLHTKRLFEDFVSWLIESNQFRTTIKIPTAVTEDDVDTYLHMLKEGMRDPTNFLVLQGDEAEVTQLREIKGFGEIINYIQYLRGEILATLQIPPILVGILDSSNRSSAEYQVRYNFYTHITSLMNDDMEEINNELLPALGINDMEIRYGLVDDQSAKDRLEMAQKLVSVGADLSMLNNWLIDNGIDIPKNFLKEETLDSQLGSSNSRLRLDKNSDQQPSRRPTEMNFAGGSREQ